MIPIGTCEQHGLHLPLCTDTIIAERMCDEISKKYGILVAPTVNYGVNLPLDNKIMTGTTGITYEILKEISVMLYLYPELLDMSVEKDFDISIETFMPYLEHKIGWIYRKCRIFYFGY